MEQKVLPYNAMNTSKLLRVALYIRVSTEEQALHGYSLQAQEEALVKYAEEQGFKIIRIYRDEGNSARKPALKRPVMQELLEDVRAGQIDRILFIKLDRWFRNVREYHSVQAILDQYNVAWQATMEDYNTATADGRLKVNIMLSVAENESDRTSERIKFVFNSKVARGETFLSDRILPFGYKAEVINGVRKVVKDPDTAHIVEDFFRIAIAYSVAKASRDVNEKYNISRSHKLWWTMSKTEMYSGTYRGIENYCEPYISKEDFAYINDRNNVVRKTKDNRIYLFSGMLFCPLCGRRLAGKYTHSRSGVDYLYYRCQGTTDSTCSYRTISQRVIEKYLLANVRAELEKVSLASEVKAAEPKTAKKKTNTDKLNERLRRLNVAYFAETITDEEYNEQTKEIKQQLDKAKKEEVEQEQPLDVEAIKAFLETDFETIYATLEQEEKRRLWRSIIAEIYIDGKRVTGFKPRA